MTRTSPIHLVVTLAMAVLLPVCCCQLRGWTGLHTDGCCALETAREAPGSASDLQRGADAGECCCSDEGDCTEPGQPEPVPECSRKSCCIKGFTPAPDWAPDVDEVGVELVTLAPDEGAWRTLGAEAIAARFAWRGPPDDDRATDPAHRSLLRTRCALTI